MLEIIYRVKEAAKAGEASSEKLADVETEYTGINPTPAVNSIARTLLHHQP